MVAQEQEAVFRRWLDAHLGLMLKLVRACAVSAQDRDDLLQEFQRTHRLWASLHFWDVVMELGGALLGTLFFAYLRMRRATWNPLQCRIGAFFRSPSPARVRGG